MNLKELGKKLLKAGAPKLGLALGGPLGAVAATALAKRIDAPSDSADDIAAALENSGLTDAEGLRTLDAEMAHELKMAQTDAVKEADLATIDLNKQDSKSGKLFVAGWRPAIGWTAATGLSYHFIWRPLLNGLVVTFGGPEMERVVDGVVEHYTEWGSGPVGVFPDIDAPGLLALTATLLGASSIRMVESLKGVKRNALSE